jgi:flagellar biosynthesis/type III secretory pathway protein FliH
MSQILRNVRIIDDSVKLDTMRAGTSPDEEKRFSLLDVRKIVAEAELRAQMEAEVEKSRLLEEQEARVASAVRALAESERLLNEERERLLDDSAPHFMNLVMEVVRRIVRIQTEVPGTIQPLVMELLQQVGQTGETVVRVAPSDLAYLRESGALSRLEGRRVQIAADESIDPGGCCVDTERGSWDCQIETQLQRIEETLRASIADWIDQEAA